MTEQFHAQFLGWLILGFKRNECLHNFSNDRIGLADHTRLRHRRMFHQRTLDFKRPDQVSSRLDHIVATPDKPEIAILVTLGEIAGQVQIADKTFSVLLSQIIKRCVRVSRGEPCATNCPDCRAVE
jgi:hypothetical protein